MPAVPCAPRNGCTAGRPASMAWPRSSASTRNTDKTHGQSGHGLLRPAVALDLARLWALSGARHADRGRGPLPSDPHGAGVRRERRPAACETAAPAPGLPADGARALAPASEPAAQPAPRAFSGRRGAGRRHGDRPWPAGRRHGPAQPGDDGRGLGRGARSRRSLDAARDRRRPGPGRRSPARGGDQCFGPGRARGEHRGGDRGRRVRGPTFVVGQELFWGQDRLDFVAEALA